jgi:hypothetical protein
MEPADVGVYGVELIQVEVVNECLASLPAKEFLKILAHHPMENTKMWRMVLAFFGSVY